MPSNRLIFCHPLLLPSVFPSLWVFSHKSALCIRWPKYWRFSFSISPSNEYQDWFPLELTGLTSLLSKRLSRVLSSTTIQKHQFFSPQPSLWSNSQIHTLAQFSRSVLSDSLWPHGLQHARPPYPSPTPGACSNSCPLSW